MPVQKVKPRKPKEKPLVDSSLDASASALARRARRIRKAKGMTLSDVEANSGITASTISKIENDAISPSYANLIRLSKGLGVDIVELVSESAQASVKTRRSISKWGEGPVHSIGSHEYQLLCTDLTSKKMQPMIATIHAKSLHEFKSSGAQAEKDKLFSHEGEELLFVFSGEVILHTEHYAPVHLSRGDCAYIDSTMGHVCISGSEEDAVVFWVCSEGAFLENVENIDFGS